MDRHKFRDMESSARLWSARHRA